MFPHNDPQISLDLYHQRADELQREADAYRRARAASPAGRHRRFGRADRKPRQVRAPVQ